MPAVPSPPPPPRDFVLKAYGAFAYSAPTGAIGHSNDPRWQLPSREKGGVAVEPTSKRSAARAALNRREEKSGGESCKSIANYGNEYAAFMTWAGMVGSSTTTAATGVIDLSAGRVLVGRGSSKIEAWRASEELRAAESAQCGPRWADCVKDVSTKDWL